MRILRFQIATGRSRVFGRNGPVPPGQIRGLSVPQWKEHHRPQCRDICSKGFASAPAARNWQYLAWSHSLVTEENQLAVDAGALKFCPLLSPALATTRLILRLSWVPHCNLVAFGVYAARPLRSPSIKGIGLEILKTAWQQSGGDGVENIANVAGEVFHQFVLLKIFLTQDVVAGVFD